MDTSFESIQDISTSRQIVKPDVSGELYRDAHDPNGYKIRCGYWYIVNKREYNGYIFYHFTVKKKPKTGEEMTAKKMVSFFKNGKRFYPEDGMLIKPLEISEDFFYTKQDPYNAQWTLIIRDWEEKLPKSQELGDAVDEYRKASSVVITDDDLPF